MEIDTSTCTIEEFFEYLRDDGVEDFDLAVQCLIVAFTRAGRLAELEPYLEGS